MFQRKNIFFRGTGSEKGMYKCIKKEGQDEGENGRKSQGDIGLD